MQSAQQRSEWHFPLLAGQAYALSGDARNVCIHGVVADGEQRQSLNLRFGLHTRGGGPGEPPTAGDAEARGGFSAWEEVERWWHVPEEAGASERQRLD